MKNRNKNSWMKFVGALLVSVFLFSACKTAPKVGPKTIITERIVDSQPSWDNNVQNSGILGTVEGGFQITQSALDRYNALIAIYGPSSVPNAVKDYGISYRGDMIVISPEALVYWMVINGQHKNGIKP